MKQKELPFIQEVLVKMAGDFLQGIEWSEDMCKTGALIAPEWYAIRRHWHRRVFEQKLRNVFLRLKKQECIITKKQDNKRIIFLTPKGCGRALREQLRRCERLPDGHAVLVLFDIPEQQRTVRALIRRLLKESGFWQLQKSVWVSDRAVFDHVKRFIKDHKVEAWMTVCSAPELFGASLKK